MGTILKRQKQVYTGNLYGSTLVLFIQEGTGRIFTVEAEEVKKLHLRELESSCGPEAPRTATMVA